MSDTPTTALLVGLAVALARAIEWLAKALLPRRDGNGNGKSGKFNEYQRLQVIEIVRLTSEETRLANENALSDLRKLIAERMDLLREEISKNRTAYVRSNNPDPYPGEERRRK